jgi:hypothetical protein
VRNLVTGVSTQLTPVATSLPNARGFQFAGLSDDGQRLAFVALPTVGGTAYNRVVNGSARMMYRDLASGQGVGLESSVRLGTTPYGPLAGDAQLSPDGRALAFSAGAPYPEAGDATATGDVYVLDIAAGTVRLASTDSAGQRLTILGFENGPGPVLGVQGFLAGGDRLAIRHPNAGSAGQAGVFVKDLGSGTLTRILDDDIAAVTRNWRMALSFSTDGVKVTYIVRSGNTATGAQILRVRDFLVGTLLNAATLPNGTAGNGSTSINALLSSEVAAVAFDNISTNLAAGTSTPGVLRAYRKLLQPWSGGRRARTSRRDWEVAAEPQKFGEGVEGGPGEPAGDDRRRRAQAWRVHPLRATRRSPRATSQPGLFSAGSQRPLPNSARSPILSRQGSPRPLASHLDAPGLPSRHQRQCNFRG